MQNNQDFQEKKALSKEEEDVIKTEYDALKMDKLLERDKWLYYAPCSINEGPIFKKKSDKSRIDILKEINSINQNEIRRRLCEYFEITPILRD